MAWFAGKTKSLLVFERMARFAAIASAMVALPPGIGSVANAAPSWVRTIDGGPFEAGVGSFVEPTPDGGLLLLARIDGAVVRLDSEGDTLWYRQALTSWNLTVLAHAWKGDGRLLLVGGAVLSGRSRGFVFEVDPATGGFGPLRLLGCDVVGAMSSVRSVRPTAAGGFVLAGATTCSSAESRVWLLRLDGSLAVEWERTYAFEVGGFVGASTAAGAFELGDGTIEVVGGTNANTANSQSELLILHLEASTNVLMSAIWPGFESPQAASQRPGGGVVSIVRGGFTDVDTLTITIPTPGRIAVYQGVAPDPIVDLTPSGSVLIVGSHLRAGRSELDLAVVHDSTTGIQAVAIGDPTLDVAETGVAACQTADGGVAVFGLRGDDRMWIARVDSGLRSGPTCAAVEPFAANGIGIWQNVIRVLPTVTAETRMDGATPTSVTSVDVPSPPAAVACFTSADCSPAMSAVRDLRARRMGNDVHLTWRGDQVATGYNAWRVRDKTLIDLARQPGSPPNVVGIAGCAYPSPAILPECVDIEGVTTEPLLFYQIRPYCDPLTEGP